MMICSKCGVENPKNAQSCSVCGEPMSLSETTKEIPATEEAASRPLTRRYNKKGKRRGKYAYAAPLGLLISLLSIIGVVAIVTTAIGWIKDATDTTYLHEEMYYYLEPLMFYAPEPFEDAAATPQDAFLNAAAYRVMNAERIRIIREKDENSNYAVDDSGRIVVPVAEIEAAYQALFGPDAKPTHKSLADSGVEYDESDGSYYVPFQIPSALEQAIVVSVDRSSDEYEVRLGFVPVSDIQLDQYGREMTPTAEMATHFKTYTLTRQEDGGYYVYACKDE